jgi:arabinogalactan oligomer/maltooligosaccharide transport system permease protein
MWAFFATFTNYFLGMFVAILINKKGIKLKKLWRTVLVMTIAIPQFVSLLYVAKLFDSSGIIGKLLLEWNILPDSMIAANQLSLWQNPISAKILLIVLNIWVGIPYIMLMATGILMNIPQDLYESSRIDGATGWKQYSKITLPYMMFVMGPYLLTSFVNNLNNFNVIYLLTQNNQLINTDIGTAGGVSVGHTDLLITWLYRMTLGSADTRYYDASIIGICVFLVVAVLSLIVYNVIPSTKNEEDYK